MNELNKILNKYLFSFVDKYGFEIKETKDSGNQFYGASIYMESDEIGIFLSIERNEVSIDICSLFDNRKNNWYYIGVPLTLLGYDEYRTEDGDFDFILIKSIIPEIIDCFSKVDIDKKLIKLDTIEKTLSKKR